MENIYTVFKLTDPDGRSYIGSTKNLKKGLQAIKHSGDARHPYDLYRAIYRIEWEDFKVEVISDKLTKSEALELKKKTINEIGVSNLYNLSKPNKQEMAVRYKERLNNLMNTIHLYL
jgi:hypothetical protein